MWKVIEKVVKSIRRTGLILKRGGIINNGETSKEVASIN